MRKRVWLATTLSKNMGSDVTDVVLPVTSVPERFRSFMPTGRCHCVMSPARKSIEQRGRRKEERRGKDNVRNEGCAAAGSQVRIKRTITSSHVPVISMGHNFPDRLRDSIPSGSRSCTTSPAVGGDEQRKK